MNSAGIDPWRRIRVDSSRPIGYSPTSPQPQYKSTPKFDQAQDATFGAMIRERASLLLCDNVRSNASVSDRRNWCFPSSALFGAALERPEHGCYEVPRPKKPLVLVSPSALQAIRTKFLNFAVRHNSPALRLLATKVYPSEMSVHQWADSLNVAETWLEQWAQDTVMAWCQGASPAPKKTEDGKLELAFRAPRDERAPADEFRYTISATPLSKLAHAVTVGGSPWWIEQPADDWERFKKEIHDQIDGALERFLEKAVQLGASREIKIPDELDKKLEGAALYILCGTGTAQLHSGLRTRVGDVSTVYRWLRETLRLLDLPMKKPGRQRPFLN